MKKLFLALTAGTALAAAAPVFAQYSRAEVSISTRISQLDSRMQAGIRTGMISPREARSLRREISDLRRLNSRYSYNGLTRWERDDLTQRIRATRAELRLADNGRYDRDTRYGYWDADTWDDGYTGQGGPYDDYVVCRDRGSGLSGIVDSVLGRNCLEVGDRASSNLYALPSDYRYRYPSSGSIYYRTDGHAIYEIDSRNDRVVGIYPMN
jgi:hypothetical protein